MSAIRSLRDGNRTLRKPYSVSTIYEYAQTKGPDGEPSVNFCRHSLNLLRHKGRVALFASAESETAAELAVCAPQSLRLAGIRDHLGSTLAMLREVRRRADDFDIIHFHVDLLPQALFHDLAHKCLVTLGTDSFPRHTRTQLP
jgi:hypothetical protein